MRKGRGGNLRDLRILLQNQLGQQEQIRRAHPVLAFERGVPAVVGRQTVAVIHQSGIKAKLSGSCIHPLHKGRLTAAEMLGQRDGSLVAAGHQHGIHQFRERHVCSRFHRNNPVLGSGDGIGMIRDPDRVGGFDLSGGNSLFQDIIAQQFGQTCHRQFAVAVPEEQGFPAVGIREINAADIVEVTGVTQGLDIRDKVLVRFCRPGVPALFEGHVKHQLYIRDTHIEIAVLGIAGIVLPVSAVYKQTVAREIQHHRCRAPCRPSGAGSEDRGLPRCDGEVLSVRGGDDPLKPKPFFGRPERRREIRQREIEIALIGIIVRADRFLFSVYRDLHCKGLSVRAGLHRNQRRAEDDYKQQRHDLFFHAGFLLSLRSIVPPPRTVSPSSP